MDCAMFAMASSLLTSSLSVYQHSLLTNISMTYKFKEVGEVIHFDHFCELYVLNFYLIILYV